MQQSARQWQGAPRFDLEMLRKVREICDVPIIASGGAGKISDFSDALKAGADALLAASVFHFGEFSVADVKEDLRSAGFPIRTLN